MESFQWNQNFETGIPQIDKQHRHLVDIINKLGNMILKSRPTLEDIKTIFEELIQYTQYHFRDEEDLMSSLNLDLRHTKQHKKEHSQFLMEVSLMKSGITVEDELASHTLLKFLSAWLAYHILGVDQNLAGQIKAIESGILPPTAYAEEEKKEHLATDPLLEALNLLFTQVSNRNRKLVRLNQSLEAKVTERTKELSAANIRLEELALTDPLTSLPNRRHAMGSLKQIWKESVDAGTNLSCMMIDVDGFKQVNDTHGHDVGDQVLIELSKRLKHSLRNDDIVCRLGGDEFFVICPNTPQKGALHLAELIRKEINSPSISTRDIQWRASISIGVSTRSTKTSSMEELIKAADKKVYEAKASGKNCIKFSNPLP